jgi:hypothetical protein
MPARKLVTITVREHPFRFTPKLVEDFPELRPFLTHLLDAGRVSSHIAEMYVKLVGRLRRQGRLADIDLIHHRNERTAANAFVKWQIETYAARVRTVTRAFPNHKLLERIRFLRRHSISPPFPGKMLPTLALPDVIEGSLADRLQSPIDLKPKIAWVPADDRWSLHVPQSFVSPHDDPCPDCTAIDIDAVQLEVIARAFEDAWGHRELYTVPPETYLFGTPPPEGTDLTVAEKSKGEKAVAVVEFGTVRADDMARVGVNVVAVEHFGARLAEGAEGVYISRAACGVELGNVLGEVWKAWSGSA